MSATRTARQLIREHHAAQTAAQELLKEEILDGERFRMIIEAGPSRRGRPASRLIPAIRRPPRAVC